MLRPVYFKCEDWVSSRICHEWNIAAWISKRKKHGTWKPATRDAQSKHNVTYHDDGWVMQLARGYVIYRATTMKTTLHSVKCYFLWNNLLLLYHVTSTEFDMSNREMPSWTFLQLHTVYPKKYAHGFCFAVLCCDYTLTDFPISIRLTSLALWQSNDCPSASKATLMNMDKYFMWIHYERLHNHNKAKHNKTVRIFLGIYCIPFKTW